MPLDAAQTVLQLALHLQELKESSAEMLDETAARADGYFRPTREEQCQHLLVSYWHVRAALLELVLELQRRPRLTDEEFLTGFVGALALVDAARFLRETFHEIPVVRRKLNEEVAQFGVPAGVYEMVQRSLTAPLHVWRLYQAAEYFRGSRQRLGEAAEADGELARLLELAEELSPRAEFSSSEYLSTRVRVRTRQAIDKLTRDGAGRVLYRLQRMLSQLASHLTTDPRHRPQLHATVAEQVAACLRPGDVVLTRKEHAVTNYFLPGFWPHAALYLGDEQTLATSGLADRPAFRDRWERLQSLDAVLPGRVLEALKDGVRIRSLATPLAADSVVLLRPELDEKTIASGLDRGVHHDGKPYDFDFDFTRSDRLVCTEVVYRSYEGLGNVRIPLFRRAGRMTLGACDLLEMARRREHFQIVAACLPHQQRLAEGDEAERQVVEQLGPAG